MFGIEHYTSFIAAILLFQVIPGAGTLAILHATARGGVAAGMAAVLGTLGGDLLFMLAALAGVAALLQQLPACLQILQLCGALYLAWLGVQLLRTVPQAVADSRIGAPASRYGRRAFWVSLTNPKVMLFFMAFFPSFMRADASALTQLMLVLHVSLLSLLYQTLLVLLGNGVARYFRGWPSARLWALRVAGLLLLLFSLRLALLAWPVSV
jgi:leucine efflux protein